jgi:signal transduction histidine kinase
VALPVGVFVAVALLDGITGKGPGVALLAVLGGLVGMLALSRRLGAANEQAERILIELEASRAAEATAAGLAERQRLAREMHDVLAHSLSGLLLQLEGARMLSQDEQVEPRLAAAIERAHHLARSGLDEARRAIGMLRDDELPGPDRLGELAARFEANSGVLCRFTETGEPRALGSEARLACYRVAQEALTNIVKHAQPERVEVRLGYEPTVVRLSIEDCSTAPLVPDDGLPVGGSGGYGQPVGGSGGYGLAGMRERAELLGGSLSAGPTPNGYRVELEIPA